jgi:hypothetical protein
VNTNYLSAPKNNDYQSGSKNNAQAVISTRARPSQEDCEFKANLGYILKNSLKKLRAEM